MSERRRTRDPLMLAIALGLSSLLTGCNFDMGFPGGGVNVQSSPYGSTVNVGFPGGGVNVGVGPGGGVSIAAPGFNMNFGFQGRGFAPRSQAALFPPMGFQPPIAQQIPPFQAPPFQAPPLQAPPPLLQAPPPIQAQIPFAPPPVAGKALPFQGAPAPLTTAGNAGEMVLLGESGQLAGLRSR